MSEAHPPHPGGELVVEVTEEQVAAFRASGYLAIERITTDEELEWLRGVYDALFTSRAAGVPGGYFDLSRPYDADGPDRLPQVLFPELKVPALRSTIFVRNALRIGVRLLDAAPDEVTTWGHMIDKPPHIGHPTPWHQDEAYWEPELDYHAVGAWMPLDDVDEANGCMCFVPGSHLGEVLPHRHIGGDPAVHGLEVDGPVDASGSVAVPLGAGGATFHHPRTLHSTAANRTERRRRAYATEVQTTPRRRPAPANRPWVEAGKAAWARRDLHGADR